MFTQILEFGRAVSNNIIFDDTEKNKSSSICKLMGSGARKYRPKPLGP